jgi:hypothetical protein
MNTRSRRPLTAIALFAVLLLPSVGTAASRDELLRLVPDDVAFCLVVQDLRSHVRALTASPFAESFRKSALGITIKNSEEFKKLTALDAELHKQLGIDAAGLVDQLCGDALVLAYRPNPPDRTNQDQGLLLLRAQSAAALAAFVERLNAAQKDSGDLKSLEERRHAGAAYFRRVERKGESFYYVNGPILAYSSQESILRQAVERDRGESTAETYVVRQLRLLGADRALAALWINPRAFDAEMERNLAQARATDAAVQRAFLRYWKAIEGAALALAVDRDARLTLSVRARTDDLPPAAKRLFAGGAIRSDLWDRFPEDALFAWAGRLDLMAQMAVLSDFQTDEARGALADALDRGFGAPTGKDFVKDVLPELGPDVGVCLVAPTGKDKGLWPHGLIALRVRPDRGADQALLSAVDFYARLAAMTSRNQGKAVAFKSELQDKVEVKYLVSDSVFPAGFQPAYALKDGYFLLASSPDLVRRFGKASATRAPGEVPLLRLSAKALHQYLSEHRDTLVPLLAEKNNLSAAEAARRLGGVLIGLALLDRVEVSQSSEVGKLSITLRVQTAQPLR